MEKPIRVLVANRPRLMLGTILTTFADQPDIEIVGEVTDESQIFESAKKTLPSSLSSHSTNRDPLIFWTNSARITL